MGPLPYGPASKHLLTSRGPDYNHSQFYVTEYSIKHGVEDFLPRSGKHVGTGYQSNFRPGLYYSRQLDELDNSEIGNILTQNYHSSNKVHFQPYQGSNGKGNLPWKTHMVKSGFVRDVPKTLPSFLKATTASYNPLHNCNYKPPRSLLYITQHKDPVAEENNYYGPAHQSNETHTRFVSKTNQRMDTSSKSVGPKEGSGFTHAYNQEPITYRPTECFDGQYPAWFTCRPTGFSVMKNSFGPRDYLSGKESFRILSKRAERDTGYSREIKARQAYEGRSCETYTRLDNLHPLKQNSIKKSDPAEYLNMVYASKYPSTTTSTFQGLQANVFIADGNRVSGRKENTGFTNNNCKFLETVEQPESLERFNTHYSLRFHDKNPSTDAILRKKKHVLSQLSNGFTKSTQVHDHRVMDDTKQQELHPYVARSIMSRNPCYVTNDYKKRLPKL